MTATTQVFARKTNGAVAAFLSRRRRGLPEQVRDAALRSVDIELRNLANKGWKLSLDTIIGDDTTVAGYDTGFSSDLDFVGAFEAPSLAHALSGTISLAEAGWDILASTEWLLGPRDLDTAPGRGTTADEWGFLALWEWNEAWQAAGPGRRDAYDAGCDVAFAADLAAGVSIAGRHLLDTASTWHQLGLWRSPNPEVIDVAMQDHERVADFQFTTSLHYLGRRRPLLDMLGGHHV